MEKRKLTADNMTWQHWQARKRYIKNESGEVVETRYDRLFMGLRPAGRAWLENKYTGESPVMVFMLGHNNVVFTHEKGSSTLYVNTKAGSQAREYIKFYVRELATTLGVAVDSIEQLPATDFPTQTITRNGTGGIDSLDAAIAHACDREIADLGI